MPKRITKSALQYDKGFAQGFFIGRNQSILSAQFITFREKKGLTQEEFAIGAEVPLWFIQGIEAIDYQTFLKSDIDMYSAVAIFCDVAVDIRFSSMNDRQTTPRIDIPTFEEEKHLVSTDTPPYNNFG